MYERERERRGGKEGRRGEREREKIEMERIDFRQSINSLVQQGGWRDMQVLIAKGSPIRQILPIAPCKVEDEDKVWEAARPPRTAAINLSLMTGKLIISEARS